MDRRRSTMFTVIGGFGANGAGGSGGAMESGFATTTLTNCTIVGNSSLGPNSQAGGMMACRLRVAACTSAAMVVGSATFSRDAVCAMA